jgi:hypothetical protein
MSVDTFINTYEEIGMTLGHNQFSDWTAEERSKVLGVRLPETPVQKTRSLADLIESDDLYDFNLTPIDQTTESKSVAKGKTICGYGCKFCVSSKTCTLC